MRCVALDLGDATWPEAFREATADVDLGLLVYTFSVSRGAKAALLIVSRFGITFLGKKAFRKE